MQVIRTFFQLITQNQNRSQCKNQLTQKYGKGWSDRKLLLCIRAAYTFTENEIVYAVRTQLLWTHLRSLMFIEDKLKRSFYIDLLFYHRSLRRLVAIDLKLGKFKPKHEGQMLLYLRYLNTNERKEGEETPIGLILCSEGNTEHIEYLMLEDSNIKVAQFYTQLPDKNVLSEKLQRTIAIAREQHGFNR